MDSPVINTLGNGLRIVCVPTHGLVSYIGVDVNAGSRDESPTCHGLAHFVEHTIFKGTLKRRSWQISSCMESIGGDLNAFTSKEETMIYTSAPHGYEERAFSLLAELITSSVFPSPDIDREKDVVIEEICSYLDSPSDSVFDDFEELAYAGSGLAHNILGSPESVRNLTANDCMEFVKTFYTPEEMVVYCCSPLPEEKAMRLAEKYFGFLNHESLKRERSTPPLPTPFNEVRRRDNHQANTIVGARTFGRHDSRRHALYLLNNYLGGPSMNSRLSRELRDKRGLVYAVDSNVSLLSDTGLMMIYFGCDTLSTDRCLRIIRSEIDRLAQSAVTAATLEKMKRQYCGQLLVTSDQKENRVMSMAKSVLTRGKVMGIESLAEKIRNVSAEELREVAASLINNGFNRLTIQ